MQAAVLQVVETRVLLGSYQVMTISICNTRRNTMFERILSRSQGCTKASIVVGGTYTSLATPSRGLWTSGQGVLICR